MKTHTDAASAPSRSPSSSSPHRGSALLVLVLLLGGVGLTAWGVYGQPISARPRPIVPTSAASTKRVSADTTALVQRGAMLQQQSCAGCHAENERGTGPSYGEIAAHYCAAPDCQAAITAAILHPSPGFANYPPGPAETHLPVSDREALASFIVDLKHKAE